MSNFFFKGDFGELTYSFSIFHLLFTYLTNFFNVTGFKYY